MTNTFTTLASQESIDKTLSALSERGFQTEVVENGAEALGRIKELIPKGASIHNGSSTTLQEIGYIDYLKSNEHEWNNLHAAILAETDSEKQADLRKQSVFSDYYLGSAHALSETGEIVIASNSGSQIPHLAYTSPNIILVISTQKITPTLDEAMNRLEKHVIPLEDERVMGVYGSHTMHTKTLILRRNNPALDKSIKVILVKEKLGF